MSSHANAHGTLSLVRCSIGNETYAVEMSCVRSIERADRLVGRRGDNGLVGAIPSPDGDVAVYSLAQRLGRPVVAPRSLQQVVVVGGNSTGWGFLVDRVSQVMHVPFGSVLPLPDVVTAEGGGYFHGVIPWSEDLLLVLDAQTLSPTAQGPSCRVWPEAAKRPLPLPGHFPAGAGHRRRGPDGPGQIVIFSTGAPPVGRRPLRFALSMTQVAEVLEPRPAVFVPGAPDFVRGLVAWRSWPVPVLDLAARLGLRSAGPEGRARLLVAVAADRTELLAFLVDPSIRTQRLPVKHVPCTRPLPLDVACTLGAVELHDETVSFLSLERLLDGAALGVGI